MGLGALVFWVWVRFFGGGAAGGLRCVAWGGGLREGCVGHGRRAPPRAGRKVWTRCCLWMSSMYIVGGNMVGVAASLAADWVTGAYWMQV